MRKQKVFSRVLSYLLVVAMVIGMIPSNLTLVSVKAEEAPDLSTIVSDIVEVKLGDETKLMKVYNGFYECSFDGIEAPVSGDDISGDTIPAETAGVEKEAKLLINGEIATTKTVTIGSDDIYFRLANGEFVASTETAWPVKSAALVGDFTGLKFVDDTGASYDIKWTPADENAELDYIGGGIWARTFLFNDLAEAVTIEYKVAANDGWDTSWGKDGGNVSLPIPAGTSELTVWVDTVKGGVYDSVRTPSLTAYPGTIVPMKDNVSIIGTVRGADVWENTKTGYEMNLVGDHLYVYNNVLNAGDYEWKLVYNTTWSGFDNKAVKVEERANVIYVYDASNNKLYDSINDKYEVGELLGMDTGSVKQQVKANDNGTLTFVCVPEEGTSAVDLVYGIYENEEVKNPTTVSLTKNRDGSFTSTALFLGDAAATVAYYYVIDSKNKKDSANTQFITIDGKDWSTIKKAEFTGRMVTLPGTVNGNGWSPAKESEKFTYMGNGLYRLTIENVGAATYEYKVAINGTWDENYGANAERNGANIKLAVPKLCDITFTYNDFSHLVVNSLDYIFADITLSGTGIPADTKLKDDMLKGIYSVTIPMEAGTYSDVKYTYNEKDYEVAEIKLAAAKAVTFYFDPITEIYYNNASDAAVSENGIRYDSKDIAYKDPYGAIEKGQNVTFTIETGDDARQVSLVVKGKERKTLAMEEVASVSGDDAGKKWEVTTNFNTIGEYQYFFVVSNGSSIVVYADDAAKDYGVGACADLVSAVPYDLIVYEPDFTTPDWMKNAVIYQIFPERFNNADPSNDLAQQKSRGDLDYEYITDWYMLTENPDREKEDEATYAAAAQERNIQIGDGAWGNEIYGGDMQGIIQRMDYLEALGVNVIYLNPICSSISSHRYDASDYKVLDPILGDKGDFAEFVEAADAHNMHIVLDGVFNHVADDSIYFDRYYKFLDAGTTTIGAYPYWAYVYDLMAKNANLSIDNAKNQAKEYFTKNYGITDFSYVGWFDIKNEPLKDKETQEIVQDSVGHRAGKNVYAYDCWWGYDNMPVILSTNGSEYQTPGWAKEVIGLEETNAKDDGSVTKYWLKEGSDGWRLDVANEVSDETWQHFRKSVKALSSDNVIIGEIWTDASEYLLGDMYDSVMNYMFRNAVVDYVKGGKTAEAVATLERLRERYPQEAFYAMMNLVASHDTTRILSYLDDVPDDRTGQSLSSLQGAFPTYEETSDLAKQLQYVVAFIQMTYAGAPTIYYGDEIGMCGADDPDDRRGMTWGKGNKDIVEWYATMAKIRNSYTALRTGSVESFDAENDAVMSYVRRDAEAALAVFANNSAAAVTLTNLDFAALGLANGDYKDLVNGVTVTVAAGKGTVVVPAYRGVVLVAEDDAVDVTIDAENLKPAYDPAFVVDNSTKAIATNVTVKETSKTLKPGESFKLTVTTTPANAADSRGSFKSSDPTVAYVDANGNVVARKAGKATITVSVRCGKTATCAVTVAGASAPTPAPVVKPDPAGTTLVVEDAKANVVVTNADVANPTVEYVAPISNKETKVTVPATVTVGNITYKVTSIADNAFKGCKKLKSVTISAEIITIGKAAFAGCTSLKKVTLPVNVETIGANTFKGCKNLKTIVIKSTKLKKVGKNAFKGINKKATIKVPKKLLKKYKKLLKNKGQAKTVKIKK